MVLDVNIITSSLLINQNPTVLLSQPSALEMVVISTIQLFSFSVGSHVRITTINRHEEMLFAKANFSVKMYQHNFNKPSVESLSVFDCGELLASYELIILSYHCFL